MRSVFAFLALLSLAGCFSSNPTTVDFPQHANRGLLLLAADSAPAYIIQFSRYDPVAQKLDPHWLKPPANIIMGASAASQYGAVALEAGTYAIRAIYTQNNWSACFHAETRSFTVNADEAVFLGVFHPKQHLAQIESLAISHNDMTAVGGHLLQYYDDITPPQITTPTADSAEFLSAQRYAASIPSIAGRLRPVVYQPAKFPTDNNILGAKTCGPDA